MLEQIIIIVYKLEQFNPGLFATFPGGLFSSHMDEKVKENVPSRVRSAWK